MHNVSGMSRYNGEFSFGNVKRLFYVCMYVCMYVCIYLFERDRETAFSVHSQQSQESQWKFLCLEGRGMPCLLFRAHSLNTSCWKSTWVGEHPEGW